MESFGNSIACLGFPWGLFHPFLALKFSFGDEKCLVGVLSLPLSDDSTHRTPIVEIIESIFPTFKNHSHFSILKINKITSLLLSVMEKNKSVLCFGFG